MSVVVAFRIWVRVFWVQATAGHKMCGSEALLCLLLLLTFCYLLNSQSTVIKIWLSAHACHMQHTSYLQQQQQPHMVLIWKCRSYTAYKWICVRGNFLWKTNSDKKIQQTLRSQFFFAGGKNDIKVIIIDQIAVAWWSSDRATLMAKKGWQARQLDFKNK